MDDAELRALRDRLDVAEVMTRYATGIDNVSLDILRGCFRGRSGNPGFVIGQAA